MIVLLCVCICVPPSNIFSDYNDPLTSVNRLIAAFMLSCGVSPRNW